LLYHSTGKYLPQKCLKYDVVFLPESFYGVEVVAVLELRQQHFPKTKQQQKHNLQTVYSLNWPDKKMNDRL
jgi:hypothetical protein